MAVEGKNGGRNLPVRQWYLLSIRTQKSCVRRLVHISAVDDAQPWMASLVIWSLLSISASTSITVQTAQISLLFSSASSLLVVAVVVAVVVVVIVQRRRMERVDPMPCAAVSHQALLIVPYCCCYQRELLYCVGFITSVTTHYRLHKLAHSQWPAGLT